MFNDLLVVELASVLAGPSVGTFFSELGAKVIKVENPTIGGDVTRSWKLKSEPIEEEISGYFSCANWGKESLAVDLKEQDGKDIVIELIKKADILLVSFKPGDAEKLKMDYETISNLNPRIIYAAITGYGFDNDRTGYDAIIQAETGFTYMNGEPNGGPVKMPVALMDVLAAHQLKEAILVALLNREKNNRGDFVSVSLIDAGVTSLVNQATNWLVGNSIPKRLGSEHPNIVPYGTIYKTKDNKEIVLAIGSDAQFKALCNVLNIVEMPLDAKYSTNFNRVKHREEVNGILQENIKKYERDFILNELHKVKIPAGSVNNMQEVFEIKEAKELIFNGITSQKREIQGVKHIAFKSLNIQTKLNNTTPPYLGEHTKDILKTNLSYDDTKIEELINRKIIYAK